jgi:hypothetical protein
MLVGAAPPGEEEVPCGQGDGTDGGLRGLQWDGMEQEGSWRRTGWKCLLFLGVCITPYNEAIHARDNYLVTC